MRPAAQTAFRRGFDFIQAEPVHVDQMRRGLDLELHQIEQVGAARDKFRSLAPRGRGGCLRRGRRALVSEGLHAFLPATSPIASTILE